MHNSTVAQNSHLLVAAVCFATSALGLTVNSVVMVCLVCFKELRHAFGYLSVSLMLADSGVLGVYLFGIAPFTLFQERSADWTEKWLGHISLTFWFASLYGMAMIAINRYLVISHPQNFRETCSNQRTLCQIVCAWAMAGVHSCVYIVPGCHFHYEPLNYTWSYATSSCQKPMIFLDLVFGVVFVVFIFCLNLATAVSLHRHNKELFALFHSGIGDAVMLKRYLREARFFFQSLIHAIIFLMLPLVSFHIISRFVTSVVPRFFCSTWSWQVAHATNGLLLLIFNDKLRRRITCSIDLGTTATPTAV